MTKRKNRNPPDTEIMPGVVVPLCKAMAMVKALQLDYPKVRKADLTPTAQEFWL